MQNITKEKLIYDFENIGVGKGDIVYVHSSLKSIGWLENGVDTLTEAFISVLGSEGTLAVPTHTLSFMGLGAPPYEPDKTLSGLGTYPNAVWRHPHAKRSGHASHSSAAIGGIADFLTENHDPSNALGYNSPIYRMVRSGGKILLIGVTHKSNTSVHLAESIAAPYCKLHYDKSWGDYVHTKFPDGSVVEYKQSEFPGCSGGFDIIDEVLAEKNLVKYGKIGNADSRLIDARGMIETVAAMIKLQTDILLCKNPDCPCCPSRREFISNNK